MTLNAMTTTYPAATPSGEWIVETYRSPGQSNSAWEADHEASVVQAWHTVPVVASNLAGIIIRYGSESAPHGVASYESTKAPGDTVNEWKRDYIGDARSLYVQYPPD